MLTNVELVAVRTADEVPLAGLLTAASASTPAPFGAALLMHGAGNSFYEGFYTNFVSALNARGIATLCANNRGHDIVNRGDERGRLLGTAFESLPDCAHDWRAWLDLLAARGHERILLCGHSLGAVKTAYYAATAGDARVRGCMLASPPRFNTTVMLAGARGAEFAETLDAARAAVAAGRGADLMATTFPLRSFSGAAAYVDKYGAGDRFDVLALAPDIACPVLALVGSEEIDDPVFADYKDAPGIAFTIVPGGDHYYSRAQTFATERLLAWIDGL